jgi:hypothetical protein
MERIITFPRKLDMSHYKADACLVWCFDNRFTPAIEEFLKSRGLTRIDLVRIAGGAKGLAEGRSRRDFTLSQIEKSIHLHETPLVILANHKECGDYGINFESPEKEQVFHERELGEAKDAVETFFQRNVIKGVAIEAIFVDNEGSLIPKR